MNFNRALALSLFIALPLPALTQEPVADIIVNNVLPYLREDPGVSAPSTTITEGEDGAPAVIEVGMIFRIIDEDDPTLTKLAVVFGPVTDNNVPTGKWVVQFIYD